jgi:uncharacterized protein YktB (UPF0637 family)
MAFDIAEVLNEMLGAASNVFSGDWTKVQTCFTAVFEAERDALAEIARARLENEIDDDDLKSQLEDEKEVLKAELLVCQVKGKIMAQKAANAAIKVLSDAIKTAVGVL